MNPWHGVSAVPWVSFRMPAIQSFNEQEVEVLAVVLRYWRSNRAEGLTRRGDPPIGPEAVDQLLTKLGSTRPRPRVPRPPAPSVR
jgi:hypothetical protein